MAAETQAAAETPAEPQNMEVDSAAETPAAETAAESAALAAAEESVTSGEDSIDEAPLTRAKRKQLKSKQRKKRAKERKRAEAAALAAAEEAAHDEMTDSIDEGWVLHTTETGLGDLPPKLNLFSHLFLAFVHNTASVIKRALRSLLLSPQLSKPRALIAALQRCMVQDASSSSRGQ